METTIEKKITHISKNEERRLIRDYQENGNNESLQQLIDAHNPYLQQLVGKAYTEFNKVIEYEDLVQTAKIGLIKAAQNFDLDKVVTDENSQYFGQPLRFLTYAHQKMIAQMQEDWHHGHIVHIPAHILRAIHFKKIADNTTPRAQARIKQATIAMKAESYDAMIEDFRNNKESRSSNSFEIQFDQNGVKVQDPTFEDSTKDMFSPNVIDAIAKLTENEWKIFKLKSGIDGIKYPFVEIAKQLNLSTEEVDKLYKRAKRILSKHVDISKVTV